MVSKPISAQFSPANQINQNAGLQWVKEYVIRFKRNHAKIVESMLGLKIGFQPTNCLSVPDHFGGLALKGLRIE